MFQVVRGAEVESRQKWGAYLEHFLDTVRSARTILGQIGTEDPVGVRVRLAVLIGLVVAQLLEDGARHIGVQVVNEDVLRHFCFSLINQSIN